MLTAPAKVMLDSGGSAERRGRWKAPAEIAEMGWPAMEECQRGLGCGDLSEKKKNMMEFGF